MTSDDGAYVWIWLPGRTEPVVAGRLEKVASDYFFNYGKSYLANEDAISIYDKELPLKENRIELLPGLSIPGCIRDAAPDQWGRRVVVSKVIGKGGNVEDLNELTYLLHSGSDRIGALDFQQSATEYVPRLHEQATLEELLESAERVQRKEKLSDAIDQALIRGSSIGGARPKALLDDNDKKYIAKFSSSTDVTFNVVKAEFIAMRMAKLAGLDVAEVRLERAMEKDVLLVERFDRIKSNTGWGRKLLLSALTIMELDERDAPYASYETLAEKVRHQFTHPDQTLRELFSRMVFNVLIGNVDDHPRNHAAFWDGEYLSLTPAYDICPQPRSGGRKEEHQAMKIFGEKKDSRVATCVASAKNFHLSKEEASEIAERQKEIIRQNWESLTEEAGLGEVDKQYLWEGAILNESVDWPLE